MTTINIFKEAGEFAENKDVARKIRTEVLIPALQDGGEIIFDFSHVTGTTQSFIHALISDLFRKFGSQVLERLDFKNCSDTTRKIISIVCDYMQESE